LFCDIFERFLGQPFEGDRPEGPEAHQTWKKRDTARRA